MKALRVVLIAFALMACGPSDKNNDKQDLVSSDVPGDLVLDGVADLGEDGDVEPEDGVEEDSPDDVSEDQGGPIEAEFKVFSVAPKSDLRAVWGGTEALFAVGLDGVIVRRQGGVWTPMLSPTENDLFAVFGHGDDDVFAGGDEGIMLHFNGVGWSTVDLGLDIDYSETAFLSMWAREGHLFVVGEKGAILHHFEGVWKKEESLSSYNLASVWGVSINDIYVGSAGGSVFRRIGGGWSTQQVTQGGITLNALMALESKDIFAGGTGGALAVHESAGWTPTLSNDAEERTIQAVWAFATDDVWFIGEDGALVHSEKGKWNTFDVAGPYYKNHSFYGLWGRAGEEANLAWGVGEKGAMLHFDGVDWKDEPSAPEVDLNDIAGTTWEDVIAVGGDGLLMRFNGDRWYGLTRVVETDLQAVSYGVHGVVAVGKGGTIVKIDGDEVLATSLEGVAAPDLFGICSGSGISVAVGSQGKLYRSTDGDVWESVSSGVFDTLRDCVVLDSGTVLAVGDMGRIVRLEDSVATTDPVATIANLHRITATEDGIVYAVGDNGLILRNSGEGWVKVHEEPGLFLYGLHVLAGQVVAVGWAGRIILLDPETDKVETVTAPDSGVLLQVWGADPGHLFVVGKKGRMLQYIED
jgi:hypothetical protein